VKAGDTLIVDYDGDEFIFNIEKITKNNVEEGTGKTDSEMKKMICEVCDNHFSTLVIPNATPICSVVYSHEGEEQGGHTRRGDSKDKTQESGALQTD
jgi:hypothetical protein